MGYDAFISHSSIDKAMADAICHALEENGVRCWIAPRDVRPGMEFRSEIVMGMKMCKIVVFLLSKNSNESLQVRHEIGIADKFKKIIIPCNAEKLKPEDINEGLLYILEEKHWLDFFPDESVFSDLVKYVKMLLEIDQAHISIDADSGSAYQQSKPAEAKEAGALSPKLMSILRAANAMAGDKFMISTSHLFSAIIKEKDDDIVNVFTVNEVDPDLVCLMVEYVFEIPDEIEPVSMPERERFSPNSAAALDSAVSGAKAGNRETLPGDLLKSLLSKPCMLTQIIEACGIDYQKLIAAL